MSTREVHVNRAITASLFVSKGGEDGTPIGIIYLRGLLKVGVL